MTITDTPVRPNVWVKESSSPYHLTIADILSFPVGEAVKLFLMDRNVFDMSWCNDMNPPGVVTTPQHFFRSCYYVNFTRTGDGIVGNWEWPELNRTDQAREWDIEFAPSCWYPLEDDHLPIRVLQGFSDLGNTSARHWRDFPASTRIGWRGPMMLKKDMEKCPDILP